MNDINSVDLAFVVDTTASMGSLIGVAKRQMVEMLRAVRSAADVDLRLGVVEYRDHPPQDRLVYRVHPMRPDLDKAQRVIDALSVDGGGDGPEAVLDGVLAACRELEWRPHARRLAVLVGDAPPHGVRCPGDAFPNGCPCGETIESVTAAAEESRVTVYALGLTGAVADSFGRLARYTGGEYFVAGQAEQAVARLREILLAEFGNLELDRRVLREWNAAAEPLTDRIAEALAVSPGDVARAVSRLSARRLLAAPVTADA
jgi:hypothetical protein